jgi:hypothetical protein
MIIRLQLQIEALAASDFTTIPEDKEVYLGNSVLDMLRAVLTEDHKDRRSEKEVTAISVPGVRLFLTRVEVIR